MSAKKGRRKHGGAHAEEHENHERWLVTYADMLTLLMVLFIVMFAISQVDQKKFAALKTGLAAGFGAPSTVFQGNNAALAGSADAKQVTPLDPGANPNMDMAANGAGARSQTQQEKEDTAVREAVAAAERAAASKAAAAVDQELDNLQEAQKKISEALRKQGLENAVKFDIDERGLVVTVVTTEVIFAGDRAELLPAGQRIVDSLAPTLRSLPNNIEVDGHTNQLPVPTRYYPSAWELSTARAATVVRTLIQDGMPAKRLTAAGFAGTRPLYPPSDPRAVTLNRRVEIIVLSALPSEQRALLAEVTN